MKPFNLERALAGDPVVTGDEKPVLDVYHLEFACFACRVAVVFEEGGMPQFFTEEGRAGRTQEVVLFMAPKKRIGWLNLVRGWDGKVRTYAEIHPTREDAEAADTSGFTRIATVPVEWEE